MSCSCCRWRLVWTRLTSSDTVEMRNTAPGDRQEERGESRVAIDRTCSPMCPCTFCSTISPLILCPLCTGHASNLKMLKCTGHHYMCKCHMHLFAWGTCVVCMWCACDTCVVCMWCAWGTCVCTQSGLPAYTCLGPVLETHMYMQIHTYMYSSHIPVQ